MLRPCYYCGQGVDETFRVCTQCGRRVRTPKQVRAIGWVLVGIGTFLVIAMGGLTVVVGRVMARSGNPEATHRFTGDTADAATLFSVFGFIALFGLASAAAGVSQIRTARVDVRLLGTTLAMGAAIFVLAQLAVLFLG